MKKSNTGSKVFAFVAALFVVAAVCGVMLGSPLQSPVEASPPDDPTLWTVFMPMVAQKHAVPGRTFYVHPDGSSRGSGTEEDPARTVMDLADRLGPGDTVVLMAATHRASVRVYNIHGAPGNPIRITGELGGDGGVATVIDGGYISIRNCTHLVVENLEVMNASAKNDIEADPDKPGPKRIEDVTLRNVYIHDLVGSEGYGAICMHVDNEPDTEGVFGVLIEDLRCERNAPVPSSHDLVGIYIGDYPGPYPGEYAPMDDVVIRNTHLEDIGTACVDVKPNVTNLLIEGLTCIRSGSSSQSQNGIIVLGEHVVIRDSYIADVGIGIDCPSCSGIRIGSTAGWEAQDVLITGNTIENGSGDFGIGSWSTSAYAFGGNGVVSYGNQVSGFGGQEYWGSPTAEQACAAYGQECPGP